MVGMVDREGRTARMELRHKVSSEKRLKIEFQEHNGWDLGRGWLMKWRGSRGLENQIDDMHIRDTR